MAVNLLIAILISLSYSKFSHAGSSSLDDEFAVNQVIVSTTGVEFGKSILPRSVLIAALELSDSENSKLENRFFRIVEATGDEALPLSDFDGRNVLYHFMRARLFFQGLEATNHALSKSMTIRIRMAHAYNPVTHFSSRNSYNNARHIPEAIDGQWGPETWFHLPKPSVNWPRSILNTILFSLTVPGIGLTLLPANVISNSNGGLDAAKIPSVIYHEAFHWASDRGDLFPESQVYHWIPEDYANYFGAAMIDAPLRAESEAYAAPHFRKNFDRLKGRSGQASKMIESGAYNDTSFVPSLFWQIRKILNAQLQIPPNAFTLTSFPIVVRLGDQLIWNSIKYLGNNKHSAREALPSDIEPALLKAMDELPQITTAQRSAILEILTQWR
ncbi:MAG: hypothetical protein IT289_05565 [Oligoflexia bacterium]|nr:hypothetical protein [Oligoflexia bacterium]